MPQFSSNTDDKLGDVRNILSRPRIFSTEDLDNDSRYAGGVTLDMDFYDGMFDISNRFENAYAFRATTCFKVVVATTPQTQGLLRCFFNPIASSKNTMYTTRQIEWQNFDYTAYSQLPGVELNLEEATSVEFKIPYTNMMEFMILSKANWNSDDHSQAPTPPIGTFNILDYLPIRFVPGTNLPRITVYTWLEDLEVIGATEELGFVLTDEYKDFTKTYTGAVPSDDIDSDDIYTILYSVEVSYRNNLVFNIVNGSTSSAFIVDGKIPIDGSYRMVLEQIPPEGATSGTLALRNIQSTIAVNYDGTWSYDGTTVTFTIPNFATFDLVDNTVNSGDVIRCQAGLEDSSRDGPYSGPLYALSSAASMVARGVPSLSSVAAPLSWAMRAGANAVAAFGYSRPMDLCKPMRIWDTYNTYQNNADGPDTSFNMGLLQDNSVKVMPEAGGIDADETSIKFIATKFAALTRFSSQTDGSLPKVTIATCPDAMVTAEVADNNLVIGPMTVRQPERELFPGRIFTPTPLYMLSTLFKYYRGGVKFRIKCNKTKFHAGRIKLSFNPIHFDGVTAYKNTSAGWVHLTGLLPTSATTDLTAHSMIWDLRESNIVEFSCPYLSPQQFQLGSGITGVFNMMTLDRITAPDNCDPTIDFVIEVAGDDDMTFCFPYANDLVVLNPLDDIRSYEIQSSLIPPMPDPDDVIRAQSGGEVLYSVSREPKIDECIGEEILSLKQLISRAEYTQGSTNPNMVSKDNFDRVPMEPWYITQNNFNYSTYVDEDGDTKNAIVGSGYISPRDIITSCYAFARGSTNYHVLKSGSSAEATSKNVLFSYAETFRQAAGSGPTIIEGNGKAHVKAPFYSLFSKVYASPLRRDIHTLLGTQICCHAMRETPSVSVWSDDAAKTAIGTRAGDDAQLAFFTCCPRLMITRMNPYTSNDGALHWNGFNSDLPATLFA